MRLFCAVIIGEPHKENFRDYYSCPVRRNFLIIFLNCSTRRKKGNDVGPFQFSAPANRDSRHADLTLIQDIA